MPSPPREGMPSPVHYLSDQEYARLPVAQRALHQARSKDSVREATGRNDGVWVAIFLKAAGLVGRFPWCAAFVTWCFKQAGWKGELPNNPASTYFWWEWAKRGNRLIQPRTQAEVASKIRRGDLFVWNGKAGGHIGFVLQVNADGSFRTIEGNTNHAGSREGDGVYDRTRSLKQLQRYPRWGFIRMEES